MNKTLQKKSSLGLAAGIHLAQAQAYKAAVETERGRRQAAKYLTNRFTEGYKGSPVNPTGISRFIPERVRDLAHGAAKQLMPEADIIGKEVSHLGSRLRKQKVNLENLTRGDKNFLRLIAEGNLVDASKVARFSSKAEEILNSTMPSLPSAAKRLLLSKDISSSKTKLLENISSQFKQTRIQPVLKSISDHVIQQGLPQTKGSLKEAQKTRQLGYDSAHAGLAIVDPATAALNATKRFATGEPMKETTTKGLNFIPKAYNRLQKAVGIVSGERPALQAKAKGLEGNAYNPDALDRTFKEVWL